MIWDKTLFREMYNNLLFIDDFFNNQQFLRCKLFFDSHGRCRIITIFLIDIIFGLKTNLYADKNVMMQV